MLTVIKKSKMYIGITLIIQAISFIALYFMLNKKKYGNAGAFLVIGTVGAVLGALFVLLQKLEDEIEFENSYAYNMLSKYDTDFKKSKKERNEKNKSGREHSKDGGESAPETAEESEETQKIEIPVDESVSETEFS